MPDYTMEALSSFNHRYMAEPLTYTGTPDRETASEVIKRALLPYLGSEIPFCLTGNITFPTLCLEVVAFPGSETIT